MARLFPTAIVVFVIAEMAAFYAVGQFVGWPQALLLLAATTTSGIVVLLYLGPIHLNRLHGAVTQEGLSGLQAGGDAFLIVTAGFLLFVPGFITDAAGIVLLLPPVRRWIGGRFRRVMEARARDPDVVDLERNQWDRVPDRQIDDQRRPTEPPP